VNRLDLTGSPKIIGDKAKLRFAELYRFVEDTHFILNFVGDPGTGKTHFGTELAKEFARRHGVSAYYIVVDEDMTKDGLVGGRRFINGSETDVLAVVGLAMQEGGAVYIDELTHGLISLQSVLNTIGDNNQRTTIGDTYLTAHKEFRIFCGENRTKHAGNVGLKPSFASRVRSVEFDYPSHADESTIAKSITIDQVSRKQSDKIPASVYRYLTGYVRKVRAMTENNIPVSARNVAMACISLLYLQQSENPAMLPEYTQESGSASVANRQRIAQFIYGLDKPRDVGDLVSAQTNELVMYVSSVGKEQFGRTVLECMMHNVDLEGQLPQKLREWHSQMSSSII